MKKNRTTKAKIDSFLVHAMPFVPTRARESDFEITRSWGEKRIKIKSDETLNFYDLISILQLLQDYILNKKKYKSIEIGERDDKLEAFWFPVELDAFVLKRGVENDINNRKTIYKSLERLFKMEIEIGGKGDPPRKTRFIYDLKPNKDFTKAVGFVNKLFYDFCLENGMVINIDRLISYKENGYAVILDTFIQSTEKGYKRYPEGLLFGKLNLNETKMSIKDKRKKLKRAFETTDKNFRYDKKSHCWERNYDAE